MAFFDPTRPGYLANPYPALARLRREEPVHWSAQLRAWVCTRYTECSEALHDGLRFTTDPTRSAGQRAEAILAHRALAPLGTVGNLGTTSGEAHRRIRQAVNPVFAPAAVRNLEGLVARHTSALIESLPAGEPFDFMAAFANPLPKQVMRGVMGFPDSEAEPFQRQLATIEVTRSNPRAGSIAAAQEAQSRLSASLQSRLADGFGQDTVLGVLGTANASGDLAMDEVVSIAAHIATVGSDPTSGALGNAVAALAAHPEASAALRAAPSKMRTAVHELLRYDSATHIAPRFAVVDTDLGGRRIRRGDAVLAVVGAANRDPDAFADPDELDIERDARRQLAFGQGEHICLGMPLALLILETSVNAFLRRFERLELVGEPIYGGSIELRIPDRVTLRLS